MRANRGEAFAQPNGKFDIKSINRLTRWIVRQQDYFKQFNPRTLQRHYIAGETHLYLGKQYQLKVGVGDSNKVRLKMAHLK